MPAIRGGNSKKKTRRHTRDLDQIHADVASKKHLQQHLDNHHPEDLPAYGEHYCTPCAKWFSDEHNFVQHAKGKPHKRRLRQLKEEPHTQRDAEAAVGIVSESQLETLRDGPLDEMEVTAESTAG